MKVTILRILLILNFQLNVSAKALLENIKNTDSLQEKKSKAFSQSITSIFGGKFLNCKQLITLLTFILINIIFYRNELTVDGVRKGNRKE